MTLLMRDREKQKLGEYTNAVRVIRKMRNKWSEDDLIDACQVKQEVFENIIFHIEEYPDWNDEEIAFSVIEDEEM